MKNLTIYTLCCFFVLGLPRMVVAQTEQSTFSESKDSIISESLLTTNVDQEMPTAALLADSTEFSLPAPIPQVGTPVPFLMYGITPFSTGGYANWDLHQGFNASLGMNVSVGFGKNRLHGVGFGQDAAFLYAVPLNQRVSVAGGVYATNMDWGKYTYRNVGITGIVAFKATDRITLYGYGNKSLMPHRFAPTYPLPNFSPDRLGGMVNFKVGESASFSIGVEAIKSDAPYGYCYW